MRWSWSARSGSTRFTAIWVGLGILAGFVVFVLFVRSLGGGIGTVLAIIVGRRHARRLLHAAAVQLCRSRGLQATEPTAMETTRTSTPWPRLLERHAAKPGIKAPPQASQASAPPARVREWFPETLLWRPELITDDNGRASLTIDLADSITTWRLSASAISAEGKLGGAESPIRVFQPFFVDLNLPVSLTRGDEVAVPAVVYNYLDKPLSVELRLDEAPWFERLPNLPSTSGEGQGVRAACLRTRPESPMCSSSSGPGRRGSAIGELPPAGQASGAARTDRPCLGRRRGRCDQADDRGRARRPPRGTDSASGTLQQPAQIAWSVPADAIEGSVKANLKLYPSTFSQLVDGLEAIFQRPYGCFEQTSSTTYPNVLALDYLRRTKKSVPQVEATARQYIHLGYQRLLGFEIAGGGFDWFGNPPANRTLTAYGLMEFNDMARVHDVDPKVIERTRTWLLGQQAGRRLLGARRPPLLPRGPHGPPRRPAAAQHHGLHRLVGLRASSPRPALKPDAQASSASAAVDGENSSLRSGFNAGNGRRFPSPSRARRDRRSLCVGPGGQCPAGDPAWRRRPHALTWSGWKRSAVTRRTASWHGGRKGQDRPHDVLRGRAERQYRDHGPGRPGDDRGPRQVRPRSGLPWHGSSSRRMRIGTWHSTQATVLALKALLAGTDRPLGEARPRQIEVAVDGKTVQTLVIPADQGEVMQQVDLSAQVARGSHRLAITDRTGTATGYQATLVYHVPGADRPRTAPSRFRSSSSTTRPRSWSTTG